ncbi:MAG: EamA family transporter [Candidatus Omnitrophica bacterium]|nr:EamA family transporter [Candidatus Omnitrophota bacterium]
MHAIIFNLTEIFRMLVHYYIKNGLHDDREFNPPGSVFLALLNCGVQLLDMGDKNKANEILKRLIVEFDNGNPDILCGLGRDWVNVNELEDAIKIFLVAMEVGEKSMLPDWLAEWFASCCNAIYYSDMPELDEFLFDVIWAVLHLPKIRDFLDEEIKSKISLKLVVNNPQGQASSGLTRYPLQVPKDWPFGHEQNYPEGLYINFSPTFRDTKLGLTITEIKESQDKGLIALYTQLSGRYQAILEERLNTLFCLTKNFNENAPPQEISILVTASYILAQHTVAAIFVDEYSAAIIIHPYFFILVESQQLEILSSFNGIFNGSSLSASSALWTENDLLKEALYLSSSIFEWAKALSDATYRNFKAQDGFNNTFLMVIKRLVFITSEELRLFVREYAPDLDNKDTNYVQWSEHLRFGAAWILSKNEFFGSVKHPDIDAWQDRSVLKVLFNYNSPNAPRIIVESFGQAKTQEEKAWIVDQLLSILCTQKQGSEYYSRALIALRGIFDLEFTPFNVSPYDGKLYWALEEKLFKPRDEGKLAYTKLDPFSVRLKLKGDAQYLPGIFIRARSGSEVNNSWTLQLTSATHRVEGSLGMYTWDINPIDAGNFIEFELIFVDSAGIREFVIDKRYFREIKKITPSSIDNKQIEYLLPENLEDKNVVVLSVEAQLLLERYKEKNLFGAMGGGLGILIGGFLRALRYCGAKIYFPLPIYECGIDQKMENKSPCVNNCQLDYSILFDGYEDEFEKWEKIGEKLISFRLLNQEYQAKVILMKLSIKGINNDVYVPFISIPSGSISNRLYPSGHDSFERFVQSAYYSRAVLALLEEFNIKADILQVHEAFPAVSIILDLFENDNFKDKGIFSEVKKHIIGFAHTIDPAAFPCFEPYLIEIVLGIAKDKYEKYLSRRNIFGDNKIAFDPFYALSQVAVSVGTVGKEHLAAMRKAFPDFSQKYFAIEDSIWPFFWMLPEQTERNGRLLNIDEIWYAKKMAEKRMIDYLFAISGIKLISGRPTIVQARRVVAFKYNIFFNEIPGRDNLRGIYYITGDPDKGGLGFNFIFAGKAHENDPLCQSWVRQLNRYAIEQGLDGRFMLCIWNTEVSKHVIPGAKASLQTSIPPYEAAGMKDKKDMIAYNVVVSSYTGGPVQQIVNVLHHGEDGNGYLFESFSPFRLQLALEDLSARFYAHMYSLEGTHIYEISQYPNQRWVALVLKYMQECPNGILRIMHNAGRMLPIVDARTAALKFAKVYSKVLGVDFDHSVYRGALGTIMSDFCCDLDADLANSGNMCSSPVGALVVMNSSSSVLNDKSSVLCARMQSLFEVAFSEFCDGKIEQALALFSRAAAYYDASIPKHKKEIGEMNDLYNRIQMFIDEILKGTYQLNHLLNVVDPQTGEITAENVRWDIAHSQGKWHTSVHVTASNEAGEILVLTRNDRFGMLDTSATGHLNVDEDYLDAAVRIFRTDTGLSCPRRNGFILLDNKIGRRKIVRSGFVGKPHYDAAGVFYGSSKYVDNRECTIEYVYVLNAAELQELFDVNNPVKTVMNFKFFQLEELVSGIVGPEGNKIYASAILQLFLHPANVELVKKAIYAQMLCILNEITRNHDLCRFHNVEALEHSLAGLINGIEDWRSADEQRLSVEAMVKKDPDLFLRRKGIALKEAVSLSREAKIYSSWRATKEIIARLQNEKNKETLLNGLHSLFSALNNFGISSDQVHYVALFIVLAIADTELVFDNDNLTFVFKKGEQVLHGLFVDRSGLTHVDDRIIAGMKIISRSIIAADMDLTTAMPDRNIDAGMLFHINLLLIFGITYAVVSGNEFQKQFGRSLTELIYPSLLERFYIYANGAGVKARFDIFSGKYIGDENYTRALSEEQLKVIVFGIVDNVRKIWESVLTAIRNNRCLLDSKELDTLKRLIKDSLYDGVAKEANEFLFKQYGVDVIQYILDNINSILLDFITILSWDPQTKKDKEYVEKLTAQLDPNTAEAILKKDKNWPFIDLRQDIGGNKVVQATLKPVFPSAKFAKRNSAREIISGIIKLLVDYANSILEADGHCPLVIKDGGSGSIDLTRADVHKGTAVEDLISSVSINPDERDLVLASDDEMSPSGVGFPFLLTKGITVFSGEKTADDSKRVYSDAIGKNILADWFWSQECGLGTEVLATSKLFELIESLFVREVMTLLAYSDYRPVPVMRLLKGELSRRFSSSPVGALVAGRSSSSAVNHDNAQGLARNLSEQFGSWMGKEVEIRFPSKSPNGILSRLVSFKKQSSTRDCRLEIVFFGNKEGFTVFKIIASTSRGDRGYFRGRFSEEKSIFIIEDMFLSPEMRYSGVASKVAELCRPALTTTKHLEIKTTLDLETLVYLISLIDNRQRENSAQANRYERVFIKYSGFKTNQPINICEETRSKDTEDLSRYLTALIKELNINFTLHQINQSLLGKVLSRFGREFSVVLEWHASQERVVLLSNLAENISTTASSAIRYDSTTRKTPSLAVQRSVATRRAKADVLRKERLAEIADIIARFHDEFGRAPTPTEVVLQMPGFTASTSHGKLAALYTWMRKNNLTAIGLGMATTAEFTDEGIKRSFRFSDVRIYIPDMLFERIAVRNIGGPRVNAETMALYQIADRGNEIILRDEGGKIILEYQLGNNNIISEVAKGQNKEAMLIDMTEAFIAFRDQCLGIPHEFGQLRKEAIFQLVKKVGIPVETNNSRNIIFGGDILSLASYYRTTGVNRLNIYRDMTHNSRFMVISDKDNEDNFVVFELRPDGIILSGSGGKLVVQHTAKNNRRGSINNVYYPNNTAEFRDFDNCVEKNEQHVIIPNNRTALLSLLRTRFGFWHDMPLRIGNILGWRASKSRDDREVYPLVLTRPDGKKMLIRVYEQQDNVFTVDGLKFNSEDGQKSLLLKGDYFNLSVIAELVLLGKFMYEGVDLVMASNLFLDTFVFRTLQTASGKVNKIRGYLFDANAGVLHSTRSLVEMAELQETALIIKTSSPVYDLRISRSSTVSSIFGKSIFSRGPPENTLQSSSSLNVNISSYNQGPYCELRNAYDREIAKREFIITSAFFLIAGICLAGQLLFISSLPIFVAYVAYNFDSRYNLVSIQQNKPFILRSYIFVRENILDLSYDRDEYSFIGTLILIWAVVFTINSIVFEKIVDPLDKNLLGHAIDHSLFIFYFIIKSETNYRISLVNKLFDRYLQRLSVQEFNRNDYNDLCVKLIRGDKVGFESKLLFLVNSSSPVGVAFGAEVVYLFVSSVLQLNFKQKGALEFNLGQKEVVLLSVFGDNSKAAASSAIFGKSIFSRGPPETLAILATFFVLGVTCLFSPPFIDESFISIAITIVKKTGNLFYMTGNGVIFPSIAYLVSKICGIYSVRVMNLMLGVLTAGFIYKISQIFSNELVVKDNKSPFFSTLLFSLSFPVLFVSSIGTYDAFAFMLYACGFWQLAKGITQNQNKSLLLAASLLALSAITRYMLQMFILPAVFYAIYSSALNKNKAKVFVSFLLPLGILTGAYWLSSYDHILAAVGHAVNDGAKLSVWQGALTILIKSFLAVPVLSLFAVLGFVIYLIDSIKLKSFRKITNLVFLAGAASLIVVYHIHSANTLTMEKNLYMVSIFASILGGMALNRVRSLLNNTSKIYKYSAVILLVAFLSMHSKAMVYINRYYWPDWRLVVKAVVALNLPVSKVWSTANVGHTISRGIDSVENSCAGNVWYLYTELNKLGFEVDNASPWYGASSEEILAKAAKNNIPVVVGPFLGAKFIEGDVILGYKVVKVINVLPGPRAYIFKISASSSVEEFTQQGYKVIRLKSINNFSSFEVVPERGATIISFRVGGQQILYCPDINQSGGIPVLWPFANRIAGGRFSFKGREIDLRSVPGTKDDGKGNIYHGMARYVAWKVPPLNENRNFVQLSLDTNDYPAIKQFFGRSKITVRYTLLANRLIIETNVANLDQEPMIMSLAFHPWFNTPDKTNWQLEIPANKYWPTENQLPIGSPRSVFDTKFDLRHLQLIGDRTYDDVLTGLSLEKKQIVSTLFHKPSETSIVLTQGTAFQHLVLYVPQDKDAVCLEPQTSATNVFNLQSNQEATPIILGPGKVFNATFEIKVISPEIIDYCGSSSSALRLTPKQKGVIMALLCASLVAVKPFFGKYLTNSGVEQLVIQTSYYLYAFIMLFAYRMLVNLKELVKPASVASNIAKAKASKKELFTICLGIFFSQILSSPLYYFGLKYNSVLINEVIVKSSPIFLVFIAPLFVKELLTFKKLIGVFMAVAGVITVSVFSADKAVVAQISSIGVYLVMASAFTYAVSEIIKKKTRSFIPVSKLLAWAYFVSFPIMGILAKVFVGGNIVIFNFPILMITALSLVTLILSYYALDYLDTSLNKSITNTSPAFVLIFSSILNLQFPHPIAAAGVVLAIGGVALSLRAGKTHSASSSPVGAVVGAVGISEMCPQFGKVAIQVFSWFISRCKAKYLRQSLTFRGWWGTFAALQRDLNNFLPLIMPLTKDFNKALHGSLASSPVFEKKINLVLLAKKYFNIIISALRAFLSYCRFFVFSRQLNEKEINEIKEILRKIRHDYVAPIGTDRTYVQMYFADKSSIKAGLFDALSELYRNLNTITKLAPESSNLDLMFYYYDSVILGALVRLREMVGGIKIDDIKDETWVRNRLDIVNMLVNDGYFIEAGLREHFDALRRSYQKRRITLPLEDKVSKEPYFLADLMRATIVVGQNLNVNEEGEETGINRRTPKGAKNKKTFIFSFISCVSPETVVWVNRHHLDLLMRNLGKNGLKAIPGQFGEIILALYENTKTIVVKYSNSGEYSKEMLLIDAELNRQLVFVKGSSTGDSSVGHSGIGGETIYNVAKEHGWKVRAYNDIKNKKAVTLIIIPKVDCSKPVSSSAVKQAISQDNLFRSLPQPAVLFSALDSRANLPVARVAGGDGIAFKLEDIRSLYIEAYQLFGQGNVTGAVGCFERITRMLIIDELIRARVYQSLGVCYLQSGDSKKAYDNFLMARNTLVVNCNNALFGEISLSLTYANFLLLRDQAKYVEAENVANNLLKYSPDFGIFLIALCEARMFQAKYAQALEPLSLLLKLPLTKNLKVLALTYRARCLAGLGNKTQAEDILVKALTEYVLGNKREEEAASLLGAIFKHSYVDTFIRSANKVIQQAPKQKSSKKVNQNRALEFIRNAIGLKKQCLEEEQRDSEVYFRILREMLNRYIEDLVAQVGDEFIAIADRLIEDAYKKQIQPDEFLVWFFLELTKTVYPAIYGYFGEVILRYLFTNKVNQNSNSEDDDYGIVSTFCCDLSILFPHLTEQETNALFLNHKKYSLDELYNLLNELALNSSARLDLLEVDNISELRLNSTRVFILHKRDGEIIIEFLTQNIWSDALVQKTFALAGDQLIDYLAKNLAEDTEVRLICNDDKTIGLVMKRAELFVDSADQRISVLNEQKKKQELKKKADEALDYLYAFAKKAGLEGLLHNWRLPVLGVRRKGISLVIARGGRSGVQTLVVPDYMALFFGYTGDNRAFGWEEIRNRIAYEVRQEVGSYFGVKVLRGFVQDEEALKEKIREVLESGEIVVGKEKNVGEKKANFLYFYKKEAGRVYVVTVGTMGDVIRLDDIDENDFAAYVLSTSNLFNLDKGKFRLAQEFVEFLRTGRGGLKSQDGHQQNRYLREAEMMIEEFSKGASRIYYRFKDGHTFHVVYTATKRVAKINIFRFFINTSALGQSDFKPEGSLDLTGLFMRNKLPEEAKFTASSGIKHLSQVLESQMQNAYNFIQRGDYNSAIAIYKRVLTTPQLGVVFVVDALQNLGLCYLRQSQYEEAEKYFNQALSAADKLDEDVRNDIRTDILVNINYSLMGLFMQNGDFTAAENVALENSKIPGEGLNSLRQLIHIKLLQEKLSDVIELSGELLPQVDNPYQQAHILEMRAKAYIYGNDRENAITTLEDAVSRCPQFANNFRHLARLYLIETRLTEAVKMLRKLIQLEGKAGVQPLDYQMLILISIANNELDDAHKIIRNDLLLFDKSGVTCFVQYPDEDYMLLLLDETDNKQKLFNVLVNELVAVLSPEKTVAFLETAKEFCVRPEFSAAVEIVLSEIKQSLNTYSQDVAQENTKKKKDKHAKKKENKLVSQALDRLRRLYLIIINPCLGVIAEFFGQEYQPVVDEFINESISKDNLGTQINQQGVLLSSLVRLTERFYPAIREYYGEDCILNILQGLLLVEEDSDLVHRVKLAVNELLGIFVSDLRVDYERLSYEHVSMLVRENKGLGLEELKSKFAEMSEHVEFELVWFVRMVFDPAWERLLAVAKEKGLEDLAKKQYFDAEIAVRNGVQAVCQLGEVSVVVPGVVIIADNFVADVERINEVVENGSIFLGKDEVRHFIAPCERGFVDVVVNADGFVVGVSEIASEKLTAYILRNHAALQIELTTAIIQQIKAKLIFKLDAQSRAYFDRSSKMIYVFNAGKCFSVDLTEEPYSLETALMSEKACKKREYFDITDLFLKGALPVALVASSAVGQDFVQIEQLTGGLFSIINLLQLVPDEQASDFFLKAKRLKEEIKKFRASPNKAGVCLIESGFNELFSAIAQLIRAELTAIIEEAQVKFDLSKLYSMGSRLKEWGIIDETPKGKSLEESAIYRMREFAKIISTDNLVPRKEKQIVDLLIKKLKQFVNTGKIENKSVFKLVRECSLLVQQRRDVITRLQQDRFSKCGFKEGSNSASSALKEMGNTIGFDVEVKSFVGKLSDVMKKDKIIQLAFPDKRRFDHFVYGLAVTFVMKTQSDKYSWWYFTDSTKGELNFILFSKVISWTVGSLRKKGFNPAMIDFCCANAIFTKRFFESASAEIHLNAVLERVKWLRFLSFSFGNSYVERDNFIRLELNYIYEWLNIIRNVLLESNNSNREIGQLRQLDLDLTFFKLNTHAIKLLEFIERLIHEKQLKDKSNLVGPGNNSNFQVDNSQLYSAVEFVVAGFRNNSDLFVLPKIKKVSDACGMALSTFYKNYWEDMIVYLEKLSEDPKCNFLFKRIGIAVLCYRKEYAKAIYMYILYCFSFNSVLTILPGQEEIAKALSLRLGIVSDNLETVLLDLKKLGNPRLNQAIESRLERYYVGRKTAKTNVPIKVLDYFEDWFNKDELRMYFPPVQSIADYFGVDWNTADSYLERASIVLALSIDRVAIALDVRKRSYAKAIANCLIYLRKNFSDHPEYLEKGFVANCLGVTINTLYGRTHDYWPDAVHILVKDEYISCGAKEVLNILNTNNKGVDACVLAHGNYLWLDLIMEAINLLEEAGHPVHITNILNLGIKIDTLALCRKLYPSLDELIQSKQAQRITETINLLVGGGEFPHKGIIAQRSGLSLDLVGKCFNAYYLLRNELKRKQVEFILELVIKFERDGVKMVVANIADACVMDSGLMAELIRKDLVLNWAVSRAYAAQNGKALEVLAIKPIRARTHKKVNPAAVSIQPAVVNISNNSETKSSYWDKFNLVVLLDAMLYLNNDHPVAK